MHEFDESQRIVLESTLSRNILYSEEGSVDSFFSFTERDKDEFKKIASFNTVYAILFIKFKLKECDLQQAKSYYHYVVEQGGDVERWMSFGL